MSHRRVRSATRYFEPGHPHSLGVDGTDDYVDIDDTNMSATVVVVETWVYPHNWDTSFINQIVDAETSSGAVDGWILRQDTGDLQWWVYAAGGWQSATTSNLPPTNTWTHLAGSYDGYYVKLYVDAVEVASTVADGYLYDQQILALGARKYNYEGNLTEDRHYDGQLAEVRVWSEVEKSQSQIEANMKRRMTGNEPGLDAYYPLWSSSGGTAYDRSGNGRDGSLTNGAYWVTP